MTPGGHVHDRRTEYRFAPAAPDEDIVYGASAPTSGGTADPVEAWIDHMQSEGIKRVCCLLTEDQIRKFVRLLPRYRSAFGADAVHHTPLLDHELAPVRPLRNEILPFLLEAHRQQAPVVVHCWAGLGRTGQVLAAWLVYAHGYTPEAAIETVADLQRMPDEAVQQGNATRQDLVARLRKLNQL